MQGSAAPTPGRPRVRRRPCSMGVYNRLYSRIQWRGDGLHADSGGTCACRIPGGCPVAPPPGKGSRSCHVTTVTDVYKYKYIRSVRPCVGRGFVRYLALYLHEINSNFLSQNLKRRFLGTRSSPPHSKSNAGRDVWSASPAPPSHAVRSEVHGPPRQSHSLSALK